MIIFDLDGTLADVSARRKAATANGKFDWEVWQSPALIAKDTPNELVLSVLLDWYSRGDYVVNPLIVIVSARNDKNRSVTEKWLLDHEIPYDALIMRPDGDFRRDCLFKQEVLDCLLARASSTPMGSSIRFWRNLSHHVPMEEKRLWCKGDNPALWRVYDDRTQVVDMWRANGLECIQVIPREQGDF